MIAQALRRIAGLKTSRGCTRLRVSVPIETIFTPMLAFLASRQQTRTARDQDQQSMGVVRRLRRRNHEGDRRERCDLPQTRA